VNHLVLSGTTTHVLSGTGSSCYRGPKSGVRLRHSTSFRACNFTNLESFGFFLTDPPFFTAEDNRQSFALSVITAALLNRNTSGKTTHTPQLKALRLDNPSLQKASRHE
jgi:hypothetical protein